MSPLGSRNPSQPQDSDGRHEEQEPSEEQHRPSAADEEREDDESSTRAVLSDAANPYHRASDRWSQAPIIISLILIGLVVLFALFEFIPGLGD